VRWIDAFQHETTGSQTMPQRLFARGALALACTALPWIASAQTDACSPGPCAAKDTLIARTGSGPVQLSVDAADARRLTIGGRDDNTMACATTLAVWFSQDHGRSWVEHCVGEEWSFPWGLPTVAFDAQGRGLAVTSRAWELDGQRVEAYVQATTDSGQTWSEPRLVARNTSQGELYDLQLKSDLGAQSKRHGQLYVTYLDAQTGPDYVGTIRVATSSDNAATWKVHRVSPDYLVDYTGGGLRQLNFPMGPDLAIGRRGDLNLSYTRCETLKGCHDTETAVYFVRSTDGGKTWTEPRKVQSWVEAPPAVGQSPLLPNTETYMNYTAKLAVDASKGAHQGRIYSVATSHVGGRLQVVLSSSSDAGATWSAPAAVSGVSGLFDQFEPSVAVSDSGVLAVSWMDRRNDPSNVKYQPMVAYSTDGGASFGAPVQLDKQFSNPKKLFGSMHDLAASAWTGAEWVSGFIAAGDGDDRFKPTLRFGRSRP
jgi:hypothetical protein